MKKRDQILKKVSQLSKSLEQKTEIKKILDTKVKKTKNKKTTSTEKYFLPDHHFKKVKVKRGLNGLGLFADEDIKKGELIVEYIGEIIDDKTADEKPENKYIFSVAKNYNIDGSPRYNLARYCNHSCAPNAESDVKKKRVFVKAIKNIKKGEEITYDYGEEYFVEFLKGHCACGAKRHLYSSKEK